MEYYRREMRRKPQPVSTSTPDKNSSLTRNKRKGTARHGYRTRAAREEQEEDFDVSILFAIIIISYRIMFTIA